MYTCRYVCTYIESCPLEYLDCLGQHDRWVMCTTKRGTSTQKRRVDTLYLVTMLAECLGLGHRSSWFLLGVARLSLGVHPSLFVASYRRKVIVAFLRLLHRSLFRLIRCYLGRRRALCTWCCLSSWARLLWRFCCSKTRTASRHLCFLFCDSEGTIPRCKNLEAIVISEVSHWTAWM